MKKSLPFLKSSPRILNYFASLIVSSKEITRDQNQETEFLPIYFFYFLHAIKNDNYCNRFGYTSPDLYKQCSEICNDIMELERPHYHSHDS